MTRVRGEDAVVGELRWRGQLVLALDQRGHGVADYGGPFTSTR
jgi:hypothetical protein